MQKFLFTFLSLCLLASCAGKMEQEAQQNVLAETKGDTITIPEGSIVAGKIAEQQVVDTLYNRTITTTGVVSAIPSAYAKVAAPFGGRVVRSLVNIGQAVKVGTPLFEISSSDYDEVIKNYLQAKSELALAKKSLERVKDLHANKVSSDKELDEAQLSYDQTLEEFNHAKAVAHEYQANLSKVELGQPMVVRSPINGKVIANDLVVGEYLKEDAEAKVVVANLSKVWVKVNITEKDAPMIDKIKEVGVRLVASPDSLIQGKIAYVGGLLDAETRTVQTLVECANGNGKMLPNMYATVELKNASARCVMIPERAVLQGDGYRYVIRKIGGGKYVRTPVEVESAEGKQYVVTEGLAAGETIVTEGGYLL